MNAMATSTTRTACIGHCFYPSGHDDSTALVVLWYLGLDCLPCSCSPNIINDYEVPGLSMPSIVSLVLYPEGN